METGFLVIVKPETVQIRTQNATLKLKLLKNSDYSQKNELDA